MNNLQKYQIELPKSSAKMKLNNPKIFTFTPAKNEHSEMKVCKTVSKEFLDTGSYPFNGQIVIKM